MYTGGTPQAIAFLKKYSDNGYLVDFYSDEHVTRLSEDHCSISLDDLTAYDHEHGRDYRGHLLALYVGDQNPELIRDLGNLYLPFRRLFCLTGANGYPVHSPDVLLINLNTREVLCVGLGRKNQSFSFELHKYLAHKTTNDENSKLLRSPDSSLSVDCSPDFFSLDHNRIARKTLREFELLGHNYFEFDNLPGNPDVAVTLNESDGLYYLDGFEDERGMTEAEVNELEEKYACHTEWIDDNHSVLREIFPKLKDWDLNTGDY